MVLVQHKSGGMEEMKVAIQQHKSTPKKIFSKKEKFLIQNLSYPKVNMHILKWMEQINIVVSGAGAIFNSFL